MGLFDLFKKSAPSPAPARMPTVAAPAGLDLAYAKVFLAEIGTITAFNREEAQQMLDIIQGGEGGHLNQGRYHKDVFNKFFLGRTWHWPWYDKWDAKFKAFGSYPPDWPNCGMPKAVPNTEAIVLMLSVSELKESLKAAGIDFPTTAKKKDLQQLAIANDDIAKLVATSSAGTAHAERYAEVQGYDLYTILMRTILFWAKNGSDETRRKNLGPLKTKLLTMGPEFEPFVELALVENRNARCPLYPGDKSIRIAQLES